MDAEQNVRDLREAMRLISLVVGRLTDMPERDERARGNAQRLAVAYQGIERAASDIGGDPW